MSDTTRQGVKKFLESNFQSSKIRETNEGFKFNIPKLNGGDLIALDCIPCVLKKLEIRRSGTGLVIILE